MKAQRGSMDLGVIMLVAFVLSLLLNLYLWHAEGKEHDARTTAETSLTTANKATKTCNDSIAGLQQAAEARGAANEHARAVAADQRRHAEQTAQQIMSTPASTPGDDCRSARDRVATWLKARKP